MFDPSQAAGQGQQGAAQAQTVTCIAQMPDGTYKVYQENEADEAQQDAANPGPGGDDSQEETDEMAGAQSAKDIPGALKLAGQLLAGGGQAQGQGQGQGAAPADDSADALFNKGFSQARGTPLNRG